MADALNRPGLADSHRGSGESPQQQWRTIGVMMIGICFAAFAVNAYRRGGFWHAVYVSTAMLVPVAAAPFSQAHTARP